MNGTTSAVALASFTLLAFTWSGCGPETTALETTESALGESDRIRVECTSQDGDNELKFEYLAGTKLVDSSASEAKVRVGSSAETVARFTPFDVSCHDRFVTDVHGSGPFFECRGVDPVINRMVYFYVERGALSGWEGYRKLSPAGGAFDQTDVLVCRGTWLHPNGETSVD